MISRVMILTALIVTIVAPRCANSQPAQPTTPRLREVPGQILVKYKTPSGTALPQVLSQSVLVDSLKPNRFESLGVIRLFGIQTLRVNPGQSVDSIVKELRDSGRFDIVEKNHFVYPHQVVPASPTTTVPNDPRWSELWNMRQINMPTAWADAKARGSREVIVAVVDSGVDYTHRDLRNNMWKKQNAQGAEEYGATFCTDSNQDPAKTLDPVYDPMDTYEHGTHVAGIIGAQGDNGLDTVGVTWNIRIMAVKFLCGPDGFGTVQDAIRAIEYAVKNGATIINASWGLDDDDAMLRSTINALRTKDILLITSAGNAGIDISNDPSYPASYHLPNMVVVGASDKDDKLAPFSNRGVDIVDIAAPGVEVLSLSPHDGTQTLEGTSQAAPHVTGCLALLRGLRSDRKSADLVKIILDSADRIDGLTSSVKNGRRLNCGAAAKQ
jgi:subtilisin family serine protease